MDLSTEGGTKNIVSVSRWNLSRLYYRSFRWPNLPLGILGSLVFQVEAKGQNEGQKDKMKDRRTKGQKDKMKRAAAVRDTRVYAA